MPIRGNTYHTGTFNDYMDAARSSFDPGFFSTVGSGIPEGLATSTTTGLLINEGVAPPLAIKPTPDDYTNQHVMKPTFDQRIQGNPEADSYNLAKSITIRDQGGYVQKPYTPEEYKVINPQDKIYNSATELKTDYPKVPFEPGMTKERAGYIDENIATTEARGILAEKHPYAYMIGQFIGNIPDITNFVPVFGEAGSGLKFSYNFLKKAFPYARSAADNAVNVAVSDTLFYKQREGYGVNVSVMDDIASAALFGVIFHGAGDIIKAGYNKLKDRTNYDVPVPELKTRDPANGAELLPAVTPEQPRAVIPEAGYTLNGEKIVSQLRPVDPFNDYTINGEKNITTSRMIINDAIYNIANGQDINLSEASKGLYEEFHKKGLNNLEEGRYTAAKTPEIIAKETELKTALANTASELDALKAADSTGIIARTDLYLGLGDQFLSMQGEYPTAVSMAEKEIISKYEGLKSDISKASSELGLLQSRIKGYRTEVPNFMRDVSPGDPSLQLNLVDKVSNGMLPREVANLLTPKENKNLRKMAKSVTTTNDIHKVNDILSSKVAPLYAGTYGRLHHGTDKEFDNYRNEFFGKNSNYKYSDQGIFLSKSFETSTAYIGFGEKANIRLENARVDNPFVVSGISSYTSWEFNRVIEKAKKLGHDSVIILDTLDGGRVKDDIFIIFDQNKITPALGPIGEVSWSTPKIEYGSSTIKDQLPTIEKIVSPIATEDIKIKEDAKQIGHNLDDTNYKLSDEELLDIEILKSSMTPEEVASFDAELKSADNLINDAQLASEVSDKYTECRSK